MIYRQNFTFYQKKTGQRLFALICSLLMLTAFFPITAHAELKADPVLEVTFPANRLETHDGKGFVMAERTRPMIVNFWATWCAPCVHELPDLAKAAALLSEGSPEQQPEQQIDVILISVDRKGAAHAQDFLDERGITGVISAYNPTSDWPRVLGLRGLPSTYLISADQTSIYLVSGPAAWADEDVLSQVKTLIVNP